MDCSSQSQPTLFVLTKSSMVGMRSINKEGREQGKRVLRVTLKKFVFDRRIALILHLLSHIEPWGLSFRDVLNILHSLQGDIVAADVVEFNPHGMTAMVAAKLVRELTAKISK
ncbi:hypothetical protein PRUPE_7G087800 [Prunus persica]|uniref:Uncharacterized protein n=1 Tax=Prunus persica TaxID=3760 RepID=M5W7S2_PRUPE|nr:hypothetical protein PRUPE_7G087800 [Prunus persica]